MYLLILLFVVSGTIAQEIIFGLPSGNITVAETSVNTKETEIGPFIINGVLYFSSLNPTNHHAFKNENFFDIYSTFMHQSIQPEPNRAIEENLSSEFHDGPSAYCNATGELFVTKSNYENAFFNKGLVYKKQVRLKMAIYELKNGNWEYKEEFLYNNPRYSVGHPAISITGDSLFFVSDMPGGYGKSDIYLSRRVNGQWQEPKNLGPKINTRKNEITPFIDKNGILYFASNGHMRKKSFNIYASLPETNSYSEPQMLPAPINSRANDYGLNIHHNGKIAYFVSSRIRRSNDNIFAAIENGYELKHTELVSAQAEIDSIKKNIYVLKDELIKQMQGSSLSPTDVLFNTTVDIINQDKIPDLKITYSYKLNTDTIKTGINSYSLSAYNPEESVAVVHLLKIVKHTTENYISKYITPDKKVNINIYCRPDFFPVFNNLKYQIEYGESIEESYLFHNQVFNVFIDQNCKIDDKMLAFLRTYGIRKYIEKEISLLKTSRNHFKHYIDSPKENKIFNEWVKIEIEIENAFSNF